MKQGQTLAEVAAEIQRQTDAKEDYVADTRRVQMIDGGLALDDVSDLEPFTLTDHAHGQIADRLSIPKRYYDRMLAEAPRLLASNANHWFHEAPERRLIRTLDGKCRAFLSDRYRRLDNDDLAEKIIPVLGSMPGARFESVALTEKRLYIKVVLPSIEGEVRVGDVVCSGVVVSNSEVGAGALSVETLLYRLSCVNGAISGIALRKHHAGGRIEADEEEAYRVYRDETLRAADEAFYLKVEDLVRAACDEAAFQSIVAAARERADESLAVLGGPVEAVEKLGRSATRITAGYEGGGAGFNLSEQERSSVLDHLIGGADLTTWGLANAITRASQDVDDYDRATELERLGGRLIDSGVEALA